MLGLGGGLSFLSDDVGCGNGISRRGAPGRWVWIRGSGGSWGGLLNNLSGWRGMRSSSSFIKTTSGKAVMSDRILNLFAYFKINLSKESDYIMDEKLINKF